MWLQLQHIRDVCVHTQKNGLVGYCANSLISQLSRTVNILLYFEINSINRICGSYLKFEERIKHLKCYNQLSVAGLGGIDPVPDLAVLMSSEAPIAPWTVTSPSGRQSSNSSSTFIQSRRKTPHDFYWLTIIIIIIIIIITKTVKWMDHDCPVKSFRKRSTDLLWAQYHRWIL